MASLITARRARGASTAELPSPLAAPRAARFAGGPRGLRRGLLAIAAASLALGSLAPAALAADPLTVTTPYPSVVVAPGSQVSFNITITTAGAQRVALSLSGAPASWNAAVHGGGFVVDAVQTDGTNPATARVDLTVPTDASGSTRMILKGTTAAASVELPLVVSVDAKAAGAVTLKSDILSLRGPSTQTFNFNLTLANGTNQDLTFSVNAQGPAGWTVNAQLTGQSQAASAIVKAGSSSGVTVSAQPPQGVAAGTYDIDVVAVVGGQSYPGKLQVEVTGTYTFTMATSDGRLNGHGSAGSATPLNLVLSNTGTADVTNVKLTSSGPSGWKITFDQATIATIPAGQTVNVVASITPSGDAIAGDYPITLSAAGDASSNASIQVRYTVETSLVWGVVGALLIVAVGAGIWWVFQRFGRR